MRSVDLYIMAELVNVKNALVRIGFNDVTRQDIIDNGFDFLSSLLLVSETEITELAKHVGRWTERLVTTQHGTRHMVHTYDRRYKTTFDHLIFLLILYNVRCIGDEIW